MIGIDFGTGRVKVAYVSANGMPELMRLGRHDQPFIPSLFYLPAGSETIFFGDDAAENLEDDPAAVVFDLKRDLQKSRVGPGQRRQPPEVLLTTLFAELRRRAGTELPVFAGKEPETVHLTVPVQFSDAAREVLRRAAEAAGFARVELIDEPLAAARAWLAVGGAEVVEELLVLDAGAGTLDWAYLRRERGSYRLVSDCPPGGDHQLGGVDCDEALVELFLDKLSEAGLDPPPISGLREKLRVHKERHCRGQPLWPVKHKGHQVALSGTEIDGVLQAHYVRQVLTNLRAYLAKVAAVRQAERPMPILMVGGSRQVKGLVEALAALREPLSGGPAVRLLDWERAEYATALGALPLEPAAAEDKAEAARPTTGAGPRRPRLPEVQHIHGWPAERVQALQKETAETLGMSVIFRDALKSGGLGPEMVVIPAGAFLMGSLIGSPDSESGRSIHEPPPPVPLATRLSLWMLNPIVPLPAVAVSSAARGGPKQNEIPRHTVTFLQPFAIGRYAVTFEEYDRFARATGAALPGDGGWGRGRRPVIDLAWHEAEKFCYWLSEQTGRRYRLPSEAEWEYACRAGTTTAFHFGSSITPQLANYDGRYTYNGGARGEFRGQTIEVGQFRGNAFGLHDMHGNIWEWCQDGWHASYDGAPQDGSSWDSDLPAPMRVIRGGSWSTDPATVRSASRNWTYPHSAGTFLGFRIAQDL